MKITLSQLTKAYTFALEHAAYVNEESPEFTLEMLDSRTDSVRQSVGGIYIFDSDQKGYGKYYLGD